MSVPGKTEDGYILLDVLVALMVAAIGFGAIFGALRTAAHHSVRFEEKVLETIESRNERADEREKSPFIG